MDLRGWDYTGRNIGPDLHRQFRIMIDCLSDSSFTDHSSWGNGIQDRLCGANANIIFRCSTNSKTCLRKFRLFK